MPSNVVVPGDRVPAYDKKAPPQSMTYIDDGSNAFRARAFDAEAHRATILRRTLRAVVCEERRHEIGSPEGPAEAERFISTTLIFA